MFRSNPTLYNSANAAFLGGVIYTHGTLTVGDASLGAPYPLPVHILGNVVANNNLAVSPLPDPNDPNTSHGGIVNLIDGSSIIVHQGYFNQRSGKFLVKPLLTVYSWQEL